MIRSRSASVLPKSFVDANGHALEDHVGRGAEQDDRVETVVEHCLVGDAAGDEERFVSGARPGARRSGPRASSGSGSPSIQPP